MTIDVTGEVVFGPHDVLRVEDSTAFYLHDLTGQPGPALINRGTVIVTSDLDRGEISGVYNASLGDFTDGVFENDARGVLSVTAHGLGQTAYGFNAGGSVAADMINDGLVVVRSDSGSAFGVIDADPDFTLTNNGRLTAEGFDAYGAFLFNGGRVENSGQIAATAHGGSAVGVYFLFTNTVINSVANTGSVIAKGDGHYASIAILATNEGESHIDNSGLVQGDYAYLAYENIIHEGDVSAVTFHNTGKVVGVMDFGTMPYSTSGFLDDTLRNEGVILGDVFMGSCDDVFDGGGGRVQGEVHGGDAADTLTGGSFGDRLFGDNGTDVVSGAGGSDTLDGGEGYDVAVFSGAQSQYRISQLDDGGYKVADKTGAEGVDILYGFESLTFSDGSLAIGGPGMIVGTIEAESIAGTSGDDVIYGLGGADTVDAGNGNDAIYASGTVFGGDGDDFISGANGGDGGDGFDTVSFATRFEGVSYALAAHMGFFYFLHVENLIGSSGDDLFLGDGAANLLEGIAGDDTLDGGLGDDTLVGGGGHDYASFATVRQAVRVDLSIQGVAQDTGQGMDVLDGVHGLIGSRLADTLIGSSGDDTIFGGGGQDHLDGGDGFDMLSFASDLPHVTISLQAQGTAQRIGASATTAVNFEGLIGTHGSDILTGDDGDNVLDGNYGSDELNGASGTDTAVFHGSMGEFSFQAFLSGGAYHYEIGGDGVAVALYDIEYMQFSDGFLATADIVRPQQIEGTDGADVLVGGVTFDTLTGGGGDDTLRGGAWFDDLYGGDGVDTAIFNGARWQYQVEFLAGGDVGVDGPDGGDLLWDVEKLQFDDMTIDAPTVKSARPEASDHDDHLAWGGFSDVIFALLGDDTIDAGAGDDTADGGYGDDVLIGGLGSDTAAYSTIQSAVTVSLALAGRQDTGGGGNDQLSGFENLIGSAFDDQLTGDSADNVLNGWSGSDTLDGGAGSDTASYDGAALGVRVDLRLSEQDTRGSGTDVLVSIENLIGSSWNDVLTGDDVANLLRGGAGKDHLSGGSGDDTLVGGGGKDKLAGGDGQNTFRFEAASDSGSGGADKITDLKAGDTIDLSSIDADLTQAGDQAFVLVAAFDGHGGELALSYSPGQNRTLLQGDLNGDGQADFSVMISGDQHAFTGFVL